MHKGDAFLLERKNGESEQSREYKVFIAKVRLGDSAEKTIQSGLDTAAPEGFRPVKILFARQGLLDFSVSVLTERNLTNTNATKTEYRFLKKSSGLPKDMNELGNSYQALMNGDLTCGSTEAENERLVFTQNSGGEKREYKIQTISFTNDGKANPDSLNEFQRLLGDGYQVKDFFYSGA